MQVEYDREADILYFKFKDSKVVDTHMLSEDLYADLDEEGNFVGLEVWRASQNAIRPISRDIAEELKMVLEKTA